MSKNKLYSLLKSRATSTTLEHSTNFSNTKRKINSICTALTMETHKYDPQKTIDNIISYINSQNRLDRLLYSEISNYIYSLKSYERGVFITNLENLFLYSSNNKNVANEDCKKIIIKLYDHSQLALYQIENINNIFATSIEDTQYELQKQIRSVEKEYISILGIFAAIVLAFVGGITFSTSILQNMHTVSIFRLLLVIDFLAFILINIMHILVKFIFTINDKDSKFFHIYFLNAACMIIAIIIIVSWFCSINKIPDFILHYFPWNISQ